VFILDGADTMRWTDADVFLKILEEPPESATLILLAPAPDALLQTIRSRCLQFHFAPVPADQIETFLKDRTDRKPAERKLVAQLSQGSPGAALSLNLEESARLRRSVLQLLDRSASGQDFAEIFASTAQLCKQEQESFENILSLFYSVLTDLLEYSFGFKSGLPRNPDLHREVESLGKKIDWSWILRATRGLDALESRIRRNTGRQLGLDALIASLSLR
jgi:DNA polymerase III subunit delta'